MTQPVDTPSDGIAMQVLVCTFGATGIRRVADSGRFPEVAGVEYLVSWQLPDDDLPVPETIASRSDFRVCKTPTRGLSANRNHALDCATAPVCVIADDDVCYSADSLRSLMKAYHDNPDIEMLTCHITVDGRRTETFRSYQFDLSSPPPGYYFTSCEISFRRMPVVASGVRFNELMGIGAPVLRSGEEEVFMRSLLRKGLRGRCLPIVICDHPGETTGRRLTDEPWFAMVRGALLRFSHRNLWPPLLLLEACRFRNTYGRPLLDSLRLVWKGALYSKRHNMFK